VEGDAGDEGKIAGEYTKGIRNRINMGLSDIFKTRKNEDASGGQQFYFIAWAQKRGEVMLKPTGAYDAQKIKTKQFIPDLPFKVKVGKGKKFYDVSYFLTDSFNFAISEKLYNLFAESNFTGWDGYPIEIEGSDLKYFGFRVLGKCGPIKTRLSRVL
jgi:hypothetical protein